MTVSGENPMARTTLLIAEEVGYLRSALGAAAVVLRDVQRIPAWVRRDGPDPCKAEHERIFVLVRIGRRGGQASRSAVIRRRDSAARRQRTDRRDPRRPIRYRQSSWRCSHRADVVVKLSGRFQHYARRNTR